MVCYNPSSIWHLSGIKKNHSVFFLFVEPAQPTGLFFAPYCLLKHKSQPALTKGSAFFWPLVMWLCTSWSPIPQQCCSLYIFIVVVSWIHKFSGFFCLLQNFIMSYRCCFSTLQSGFMHRSVNLLFLFLDMHIIGSLTQNSLPKALKLMHERSLSNTCISP